MSASAVGLDDMLRAREARWERQKTMLAGHGLPLVSFTMNIAGPCKSSPLILLAFYEGLRRAQALAAPAAQELCLAFTGPEALWAAELPAAKLKGKMEQVEEGDELGRLFDLDVMDAAGEKLSRSTPRRCLVCGETAAACARSRRHGLEAIAAETQRRLLDFAAQLHGDGAVQALLAELYAAPKPGLVDRNNCGAHRDMDVPLFEKSAAALGPYFQAAFRLGCTTAAQPYTQAMAALRQRGMQAEEEMFAATKGVNTHKGMVYTLGLLLCGAGRAFALGSAPVKEAAALAQSDLDEVLRAAAAKPESHGAVLYAEKGVRGIRGEAADGFPHVCRAAGLLAEYAAADEEQAPVWTLAHIMAELEDTNVLHRAGTAGAARVKAAGRAVCALPQAERSAAMAALDEEFIREGISPGGAADVLAAGLFLRYMAPYWQQAGLITEEERANEAGT